MQARPSVALLCHDGQSGLNKTGKTCFRWRKEFHGAA
jgi:hypothetical protein